MGKKLLLGRCKKGGAGKGKALAVKAATGNQGNRTV